MSEYKRYTIADYEETIDKIDNKINRLEADNARLRQQLQSLVDAWNEMERLKDKYFLDGVDFEEFLASRDKFRDVVVAVKSALEKEEK